MDLTSTDPSSRTLMDFRDYLLDCGACVVGVADLAAWPGSRTNGYRRAVSLGVALRPDPILNLRVRQDRPAEADRPAYAALAELAQIAIQCLEQLGAKGEVLVPRDDPEALTHEEVAVQAGVAWIGKSGRPVTWDFGTAIRLTTVLTDADLPLDQPVKQSFCGACLACTEACVAHAPSGVIWTRGMKKADFFNETACAERRRQLAALGRDCRYCMSVCPFTTVYLINCGLTVPTEPSADA
jgi:epoxyqueuosine reductase QueG